MGWYDRRDLPIYYGLHSTFATSDRYFSSVLSQTFPNRFYLLAGTSFGHIRNDLPPPDGFTQKTIFEELDAAGITWKVYYSQIPFAAEFAYVRDHAAGHLFPISQYYADAATGDLPQVSYVDPIFLGPADVENDEHPPSNVQVGERFASDVMTALFHSPNWSSSALFMTYDENGGFYDHVAPPPAPVPDGIPPMLEAGDVPGAFDRYGFRVPAVVVSPYSRPHFVPHVVDDHTSILKFIETRFGLPALTNRTRRRTRCWDSSTSPTPRSPRRRRCPGRRSTRPSCLRARPPPRTGESRPTPPSTRVMRLATLARP
jgi:phospholipase C